MERWPWEVFNERKLCLKGAPKPLQAIIWILVAQVVVVLVLLLTQSLPQPTLDSGVSDFLGGRYVTTLPIFLVLNLSLVLGYWFALAGALRVRWFVGLPIVAGVIFVLAFEPLTKIIHGVGEWEHWGQLAVLAVVGLWALWVMVWQLGTGLGKSSGQGIQEQQGRPGQARPRTLEDAQQSHLLRGGGFVGMLALLLGYYGLELVLWASAFAAHQEAAANTFLLSDLATQEQLLTNLLIVVLLLGSTDLLEWGQMAASSGVRLVQMAGSPRVLWGLTLLASLATIWKVLSTLGSGVLVALLVAGVLALVIWGLLRLAPIPGGWSDDLRSRAVQIGALLIFGYLILISQLTGVLGRSWGLLERFWYPLFVLVVLPIGLAALGVSLFALLHWRKGETKQQALWLFVVLVLLMLVVGGLPDFLIAGSLPLRLPLAHLQSGVQLLAGLGVLAWALSLPVRGRLRRASGQLNNALLLLAGLQVVFWVQNLLDGIATLQGSSTFWLALLFLGTSFWALITSGDQLHLTGKPSESTPGYPREGRVLLYAGSVLVSTILLLYLGSLHIAASGAVAAAFLSQDVYSPLGLSVLGSLVVILPFLLKMLQPSPRQAPAGTPAPVQARRIAPGGRARAISWSVLGCGLLLSVLLMAFVLTSAIPQLRQQNARQLAQGYSAAVPGPDCDGGGASWALTPNSATSARCLPAALQITDSSRTVPADIDFLPPGGQFPPNYSVSVQVNLSQIVNGCVGVLTRFSPDGEYQSGFCAGGLWIISKITPSGVTVLASGQTPHLTSATLGTVSEGANQRLLLNGSQVGTVSDATLAEGGVWLRLQNFSASPATALFSDFHYLPLPATPGSPAPSPYRAATPGPACDHGGAQWALATFPTSEVHCLPGGLQISAHQLGVVEFTPPAGLFSPDYQVSLTADVSALPVGCVGLITRATGLAFYLSRVCKNGLIAAWSITLDQNGQAKELKQGVTTVADVYTLTASASGAQQSFTINGQQVATVADASFAQTAYLGIEVINLLPRQVSSAVVSAFSYTPRV